MAKLSNHSDPIRANVECANCGRDIQVSGDAFDEIIKKLSDSDDVIDVDGARWAHAKCGNVSTPTIEDDGE